ncbi:M15 family metallopeptidase [Demequina sp. SO4-13]|uniref:M15 family metallopeptidase n=1 Tax=Demequina sp. SO4-13 TaxID=3401027 RepID=UPI003AF855E3
MSLRLTLLTVAAAVTLGGCSALSPSPTPTMTVEAVTTATATPSPEPAPTVTLNADQQDHDAMYDRPQWLGTIPLEVQPDNLGERKPTPEELRDRQLAPRPWLPEPETDEFVSTISEVPDDVAERSSWRPECPVGLDELSYLTMTYWGFDQQPHLGEMIVHRDHAEDVVGAFETIYEGRFPIEEMRVISLEEHLSPPTGDQNITSAFWCRRVVGAATVWSEHSKGLAIDINPFHNPYYKGEELFPELSEAYLDRSWERDGMIYDPSIVYDAFEEMGWTWGGHWDGREDWMHFSAEGG